MSDIICVQLKTIHSTVDVRTQNKPKEIQWKCHTIRAICFFEGDAHLRTFILAIGTCPCTFL